MAILDELLARLLGGGAPDPAAAIAGNWRGPDSEPNRRMPVAPQGAPPAAFAEQAAPSRMPQGAPAGPQPSGGGGFDQFLGGIFGGVGGKGKTIKYLMDQGLDEGTAYIVANDKAVLQDYLRQKMGGGEPRKRQLIDAGKGRLYDADTNQWITAPDVGTDAPTIQSFYDDKGAEYKAEWDPQTKKWEPVGGSKLPSGMSLKTNPDGTVELVQGPGGAGQKLTESQSKDLSLYTQGQEADKRLAEIDTQLTDWGQQNADKLPLGLGNYLREPEFRQAKQAGDRFLSAMLRKESGAAVTPDEFSLYGPMFLPIPGDDDGTLQQKRRARQVALLAIRSGLGTAEAVAAANELILGNGGTPGTPSMTVPNEPSSERFGGKSDRLGPKRLRFNPATGALE